MELALEHVQTRYAGRVRIARVDAKGSSALAERYGITCLPTTLLFEDGRVVRRFLGTAMAWEVEDALREVLQDGSSG